MRRIAGACILAAALAVALSSIASAGGWATVSVDNRPEVIYADASFSVAFTVLQHGMTPMDGLTPGITFTHAETGEVRTTSAVPTKIEGRYVADVTLPASGEWNWEIDAFGTHTLAPFTVADGPTAVAGASTSSTLTDRALPLSLLGIGVVAGFAALWSAGWIGRAGTSTSAGQSAPTAMLRR